MLVPLRRRGTRRQRFNRLWKAWTRIEWRFRDVPKPDIGLLTPRDLRVYRARFNYRSHY